jgi:predicted component of type VI protein secretion system
LESANVPDSADEDLRALASELAHENQMLHKRLVEMTDFAEEAVARQVDAERARDDAQRELEALLNTRAMRALRPLRAAYGRVRHRLGR